MFSRAHCISIFTKTNQTFWPFSYPKLPLCVSLSCTLIYHFCVVLFDNYTVLVGAYHYWLAFVWPAIRSLFLWLSCYICIGVGNVYLQCPALSAAYWTRFNSRKPGPPFLGRSEFESLDPKVCALSHTSPNEPDCLHQQTRVRSNGSRVNPARDWTIQQVRRLQSDGLAPTATHCFSSSFAPSQSNIGLVLHGVMEYDLSLRFLENALTTNTKYHGPRSLKVALRYKGVLAPAFVAYVPNRRNDVKINEGCRS